MVSNTNLPKPAIEYIDAVIKKMRYRKKIRAEVRLELIAHFEDALKNCEDELRQDRCKTLIEEFGDIKLLGVLLRRSKKRCRAGWRTAIVRVFQGIGILFLGLIMYCVYISFAQPNIRVDYIAEMTNVSRPVADEDLNAAVLYQKAIDNYVDQPKIMHKVEPLDNEQPRTKEMDLLAAIDDKKWIAELTEEEVTLLRQWVADNDKAIEYFRAGSQRPYCWWDHGLGDVETEKRWMLNVLLAELGPLKKMVMLICWEAKLKASDGEIEAGFNDLLKCYKAGEHLKGTRLPLEQLVGIAMQVITAQNSRMILDNTDVDSGRLKAFQEEFEVMQSSGIYIMNYEIDRFLFSDFIQRAYTDNGKGGGRMIPRGSMLWGMLQANIVTGLEFGSIGYYATSLGVSLVSADRKEMTAEIDRIFQVAEKWAKMTPWQLRNSGADLSMGFLKWSRIKQTRYWPVLGLVQTSRKLSEMSYRNKAEVDALIAIIAILRYEKEKGDYPETLEKLVEAGYLHKVPMDPYSDKSLIYERKDDGFILYSFGENYTDDGGTRYRSRWAKDRDAVFWPVWRDEN